MDIGKKYNFTISISRSKIGNRREECGDTGENVTGHVCMNSNENTWRHREMKKIAGAAVGEQPGERK